MLTAFAAIQQLIDDPSAFSSPEALRQLASQVSVEAPGAVTVLYSGLVGSSVSATDVVTAMLANGEDIRVINTSEAARFLDSAEFKAAVANAYDIDVSQLEHKDYTGPAKDFLYSGQTSVWADASARFVSGTVGDVRTIAPFADPTRTFLQTELQALLNNPAVTSIDGVPKDYYVRMQSDAIAQGMSEAEAMKRVQATVTAVSLDRTATLQFALDAEGQVARNPMTGALQAIGTQGYFADSPITGTTLPTGVSASTTGGNLIAGALQAGTIPGPDVEHLTHARAGIEQLKQYAGLDNAGRLLNKLGVIGDVVALGFVVNAANAAYEDGDAAGAQRILQDWAIDFTGGLAAGLAAAKITASALAPLYLAGPAGAIVAGGLTLLAGLAGGIFGGNMLSALVSANFNTAQSAIQRRDPLTFDLDGDGLETIGLNATNPVYFDHNGDGIKTSSGWVLPDDGFLVLDRNGNGTIDNGAELFGDSTPIYDAEGNFLRRAVDGFDALAQEDTNGDGVVDANDANWANLRIWRDNLVPFWSAPRFAPVEEVIRNNENGVMVDFFDRDRLADEPLKYSKTRNGSGRFAQRRGRPCSAIRSRTACRRMRCLRGWQRRSKRRRPGERFGHFQCN